ncbi:MAG: hypothetical protein IIC53_12645 [Proteobacteria bacterium]|nr:hypothetical protein [Pseudomonadota bacterium]
MLALTACSPGRTIESWRVLKDIAAGAGPSTLKEVTPAPTRQAIAYRVRDRAYAGDLYRPGEAAKAALVLVPGAARAGARDRERGRLGGGAPGGAAAPPGSGTLAGGARRRRRSLSGS